MNGLRAVLRAGDTITHATVLPGEVRVDLEEPFTAEGDCLIWVEVDPESQTARVVHVDEITR